MNSSSKKIEKSIDIEMIRLAEQHDFNLNEMIKSILKQAAAKGVIPILDLILSSEGYKSRWNGTLLKTALNERQFDAFTFLLKKLNELKVLNCVPLGCIDWCIQNFEYEILSLCLDNYDFGIKFDRFFDEEFDQEAKDIFLRAFETEHSTRYDQVMNPKLLMQISNARSKSGKPNVIDLDLDILQKTTLKNVKQNGCIRIIFEKCGFFDVNSGIQLVDQAFSGSLLANLPNLFNIPIKTLDACLVYFELAPLDYLNNLGKGHPHTTQVLRLINHDFVRLKGLTTRE
jgi:hypothetical protein